uniref:Protein osiris 22 n=1 Tax=Anopheles christyi TaxID=43041 RepID=A0A182K1K6_9DIPT
MASFYRTFLVGALVLCAVLSLACAAETGATTDADSSFDADIMEGRTFGHHFLKRISFAMIPAAFIVGVITTLLSALTVVSMKGLGVGVSDSSGAYHLASHCQKLPGPATTPRTCRLQCTGTRTHTAPVQGLVKSEALPDHPQPSGTLNLLGVQAAVYTGRTMGRKRFAPSVALLFVVLACCPLPALGEMRKSWQTKSVDVQAHMLKAARLEDHPNGKPPEPNAMETRSVANESSTGQTGPGLSSPDTVQATDELKPKPTAMFSSRVRSKYGTVAGAYTVPDKVVEATVVTPPQADGVRAVPLVLEHSPEEIQIDDATVQDDDDEDDEEEDDDDPLGWNGGGVQDDNGKQYDLIENILEEVEGRVAGEKRNEADELSNGKAKKPAKPIKNYTFPPVLNMTIDEPNNIVKVKLNQDIVRDMLNTGRESGGGLGGKKMLRYVLPLFILPFLIQSAVIPFMLTAIKLFLLKSLMAGKLAIFLLLLGAFKNFTKKERDVYVKDLPDRRYEPSSEGFAYLAEGRPSGWVN